MCGRVRFGAWVLVPRCRVLLRPAVRFGACMLGPLQGGAAIAIIWVYAMLAHFFGWEGGQVGG